MSDDLARESFLQQLAAWIAGQPEPPDASVVRRKITPSPATTMPAADRALGRLRQREPDASEMALSEGSWTDPGLVVEGATFGYPKAGGPSQAVMSPLQALLGSEGRLERILRHELEHSRQWKAGVLPSRQSSENRAYEAASVYRDRHKLREGADFPSFDIEDVLRQAGR